MNTNINKRSTHTRAPPPPSSAPPPLTGRVVRRNLNGAWMDQKKIVFLVIAIVVGGLLSTFMTGENGHAPDMGSLLSVGTSKPPAVGTPDMDSLLSAGSSLLSLATTKPPVVAYVISLIKCGDHQSTVSGLTDAVAVLRHSVHRNSVRSGTDSRYDYKFYALVHKDAERCSGDLKELGFEILVRDSPIKLEEIQSESLRKAVPKAWCCGHAEFIKLYAYTLTEHPVVVHMDVDFLLTKPMVSFLNSTTMGPAS
jgi:hypothetical protein